MVQTNEHVLVNPVTQPVIAPFNGAPRLASLAGTRLGLIDDSKRNADVLLEELAELLRPAMRSPASSGTASPAPPGPQIRTLLRIGGAVRFRHHRDR